VEDIGSPSDGQTSNLEEEMQKLVKFVLSNTLNAIDPRLKQTFLLVAKTFFFVSCCSEQEIDYHIAKVLFHKVG